MIKKKKNKTPVFWGAAAIITVSIALIYFFPSKLLTFYASIFTVDNPTKGADAILVLAGGPENRPAKAIELLNKGYAKNIFITDTIDNIPEKYRGIIRNDNELLLKIFKRENIIPFKLPSNKGGVTSTFDEAHDLARYIKNTGNLNRVIIVTDSFHTARAYYAFKKIFALNKISTKIEMAAASNQIFNESNWWHTETGLTNYILEPIKFMVYLLRDKNVTFVKEN